jgi:hypothetical protein
MHSSSQSLYRFVAWDLIIAARLSQTSDADETVAGVYTENLIRFD